MLDVFPAGLPSLTECLGYPSLAKGLMYGILRTEDLSVSLKWVWILDVPGRDLLDGDVMCCKDPEANLMLEFCGIWVFVALSPNIQISEGKR